MQNIIQQLKFDCNLQKLNFEMTGSINIHNKYSFYSTTYIRTTFYRIQK